MKFPAEAIWKSLLAIPVSIFILIFLAKKDEISKEEKKKMDLVLEKSNEINIINTAKNNEEKRNLENIKINKEKTNPVNLSKYMNEKDKSKAETADKKDIFLNDPDKIEENAWKKHMDKLGINQLKPKEVKKDEGAQNKNNYDDEFNQVFEVSEKLTFKEEQNTSSVPKQDEKIKATNDKKKEEKVDQVPSMAKKDDQKDKIVKKEINSESNKKEEPPVRKLEDVKKKKNIDKAIALEHLKADESNKIVKEEVVKSKENLEDQSNKLIQINPKAKVEEKSNLKGLEKDLSDLISLQKDDIKKEIDINPVKDEVEVKKIEWESNNNINNDFINLEGNDAKNFAQSSSNFRLSDTLNIKRAEKNYQINHDIPDVSNVKPKVDTGLRRNRDSTNNFNKTGMMNNFFKKNEDNKTKLPDFNRVEASQNNQDQDAFDLQKLEKDNKNELKQFIQTVMANKMEKRNNYFDQNNVS